MNAMLLAAGLGQRLLPLTLELPKAAIPVLGRPLLTQLLRGMARDGARRVVVNLHRHAETLRALVESESSDDLPAVEFTHEDPILGTAGGLRNAAALLRGDGPILVRNSDFLADIDVAAALRSHRDSGSLATLVLAAPRPGYAAVDVDERGRVISIAGMPAVKREEIAGSYLFTGCHIIEEGVLERIPREGPSHIVRDVYRDLAAGRRLGSYLHDGFWWEFGSPRRYLDGCLRLLDLAPSERSRVCEHDPVRKTGGGVAAVGSGAVLGRGSLLRGRCAVGRGTRVGDDSVLEDTVVLAGCRIGPGCRLGRAVIGPGAEIPECFEARDTVVCADRDTLGDLPPGIERREGLLLRALGSGTG